MYIEQSSEAVIQNLKDAGCDENTINAFMEDITNGKADDSLQLLAAHRRSLLNALHKEQNQLDCLHYLVFTMGKKAKV